MVQTGSTNTFTAFVVVYEMWQLVNVWLQSFSSALSYSSCMEMKVRHSWLIVGPTNVKDLGGAWLPFNDGCREYKGQQNQSPSPRGWVRVNVHCNSSALTGLLIEVHHTCLADVKLDVCKAVPHKLTGSTGSAGEIREKVLVQCVSGHL